MITDVTRTCNLATKYMIMGLCAVLSSGCNISVPQAESSYNFAKNLILADDVFSQEQHPIWLASVGDRGAVLRPYLSGGWTVFANTDGDAIAFDGWTVRSVSGFGLSAPISISGKDGLRNFAGYIGTYSTACDPWVLEGLVWSQSCGNGDGIIEINEAGNIERIILSLGKEWGNVTLRVAK